MQIAQDSYVILEYNVRLADGSFVRGGPDSPASLNFIVGYGETLQALERRLLGMREGEEADFVLSAREAFGERDEAQVQTRAFTEFPQGRNLTAGKWVIARNESTGAQYSYFVKEKTDEAVVLDFNHPLAGQELHYHVKVVRVREADREELAQLRPCQHGKEEGEGP